jgi:acyl dehydratase
MLYERFLGLRSEPVRNTVERGAVRRFAEAIADPSPLYVDEEAAARSRYGRIIAPPTFPRTFDYGRIEGLELPPAGLIHGEFRIAYERPLLVGEELLCRMELKDSYDKRAAVACSVSWSSSGEAKTCKVIASLKPTTPSSSRSP